MLDAASIGVGLLFFVGFEVYVRYCDRLLRQSQSRAKGGR